MATVKTSLSGERSSSVRANEPGMFDPKSSSQDSRRPCIITHLGLVQISKRQLQFAIRMAMEIWKGSLLRQRYLLNREIFQRQLQIASLRAADLEEERKDVLEKLVLRPMRHHSKWVKILLNYTEKSEIFSANWIWRKGKRKIFLGKRKIFLKRRKHVKNL
ncbi:hypothetical protein Pcinc_002531 [Petrolisthes cinctipes]|uniref:Uncharacterized protein n=1 Tax=Petrolisthes cinctipes TaxID=88211 RepID=A0AAE1GL57_PETCI|nr:hypothetical protein Pcinc_002531 [Petrolisthes cinctipes]